MTPTDTQTTIVIKLPTSSDLFKKHFNDMGQVGLFHPNMEKFFSELNDICIIEDSIKLINKKP